MSSRVLLCCHGSARYSWLRCAFLGSLSALLFHYACSDLTPRFELLTHHHAAAFAIYGWLVFLPCLIGICALSERRLYVINGMLIHLSRLVMYVVDIHDLSSLTVEKATPGGVVEVIAFRRGNRTCLTIRITEWRVSELHSVIEEILHANPELAVDPVILSLPAPPRLRLLRAGHTQS